VGFELYKTGEDEVKRAVAWKAQEAFKQQIRQLTRRSGGRSIEPVIEDLRPYVLGWKACFGLAQTPKLWLRLDEWMRHRMRAIQLKHWQRGTTIYRRPREGLQVPVCCFGATSMRVNMACWPALGTKAFSAGGSKTVGIRLSSC
jgi:hypothetical protein